MFGNQFDAKPPMSERRRTVIIVISVTLMVAAVFGVGLVDIGASLRQGSIVSRSSLQAGKISASDHAFSALQKDGTTPYRYDPCLSIHVVVNDRTAIKHASRLVAEAIDRVHDATGLSFVIDGPTDERPRGGRPVSVEGYDSYPTPVLLAWSDPKELPRLKGDVTGFAGSVAERAMPSNVAVYQTGIVALDGPQLRRIVSRPNGWASARAIVMHELGHLVGLDHVKKPGEIMQPTAQRGLTSWGPGDLAGLKLLGKGPCF